VIGSDVGLRTVGVLEKRLMVARGADDEDEDPDPEAGGADVDLRRLGTLVCLLWTVSSTVSVTSSLGLRSI